jgi:hypothetical protein
LKQKKIDFVVDKIVVMLKKVNGDRSKNHFGKDVNIAGNRGIKFKYLFGHLFLRIYRKIPDQILRQDHDNIKVLDQIDQLNFTNFDLTQGFIYAVLRLYFSTYFGLQNNFFF